MRGSRAWRLQEGGKVGMGQNMRPLHRGAVFRAPLLTCQEAGVTGGIAGSIRFRPPRRTGDPRPP